MKSDFKSELKFFALKLSFLLIFKVSRKLTAKKV